MVLNVHTSKKEGERERSLNTRNMEYTVRMYVGVIKLIYLFVKFNKAHGTHTQIIFSYFYRSSYPIVLMSIV